MRASTPQKPNFAFPKTVVTNSEAQLSKALAASDGPAITRALINGCIASAMIDPDSIGSSISKIEQIAATTPDPVLCSMLSILEARLYSETYFNDRYIFDRREMPLTPLPSDIQEWSGEQFKQKITSLIDRALQPREQLLGAPLESYASVLTIGSDRMEREATTTYFPTLFDFVAYQGIMGFNKFSNANCFLAPALLSPVAIYLSYPYNYSDPYTSRILDIFASLLKSHKPKSAPYIHSDIERINFVSSRIFNDDDSSTPAQQRFEQLRKLYSENTDSPYSGDFIIASAGYAMYSLISESELLDYQLPVSETAKEWVYNSASEAIKRYPSYLRVNKLRNIISDLKFKNVSMFCPSVTAPGFPTKFDVTLKNVTSCVIKIYKLPDSNLYNDYVKVSEVNKRKPVASLPVEISDAKVPFGKRIMVEYRFPEPGIYVAVPFFEGSNFERNSYSTIHVSGLALAASSFGNDDIIWGIDPISGAPVNDAEIFRDKILPPNKIGVTDSIGALKIAQRAHSRYFIAKEGDCYAKSIYPSFSFIPDDPEWNKHSNIFTSLAIYRPGDTVDWSAICYLSKGSKHVCANSHSVKAMLFNASGEMIDSLSMTTDNFGRATGSFTLPKDELTGNFSIRLDDYHGHVSFKVADYKMPGFRVILEPVETDFPVKGAATLRGKVETYSGFPVADANIDIKLSAEPPYHYYSSNPKVKFQTLLTSTDPLGKFEQQISAETLKSSPIPNAIFDLEVTATSASGESQQASTLFALGARYQLILSAPRNLDVAQPVTDIKAKVVDYRGESVNIPVELIFNCGNDSLKRFVIDPSAPDTHFDLSDLPSGRCQLTAKTLSENSVSNSESVDITLYRPTDTATPSPKSLLWYPKDKITISGDSDRAQWLYATDCPTHLLVTIYSDNNVISQRWVAVESGMHSLDLEIPHDVRNATLAVALFGNCREASARIAINRMEVKPSIEMVTESFRDHIIPGSEETWVFRVKDQADQGVKSAVILDMYNTALDIFGRMDWNFFPYSSLYKTPYYWESTVFWGNCHISIDGHWTTPLDSPGIQTPTLDTYGHPLIGLKYMMYFSAPQMAMSRNTAMEMKAEMAEDSMSLAEYEEAAVEAEGGNDADTGTGSTTDNPQKPRQADDFRDHETPLAFFRPNLTTDDDGKLTFSFTVPNANTLWGLRAVAFTDSLLSTSFSRELLANKPVMVQPNLPRFLRTGDKARILALVMNNSDEAQTITTTIEILNPADGSVVKQFEQTDEIAPSSSVTAGIDVDAPFDTPFICYRIKASNGKHTDGEQALLPILPAVSEVFETLPFYVAPAEREFSMELPEFKADTRAALEYCDNPIWYVVTALPGLREAEASTANEAGASIYSAAVAAGLLRDFPEIADILREWSSGDKSDGMLRSMLEKNTDLKQLLLSATPWMMNAKNDTERMERLVLLFDENNIRENISKNVALLSKLQCDNGGWRWCSSYDKPSRWTTENLLLLMGDLFTMGYLPSSPELSSMICKALKWIDSETKKDFAKYPHADYTLYVSLRDRFKKFPGAPTAPHNIVESTISQIKKNWKDESVAVKAIDAMVLAEHSQMQAARTILKSLDEFSAYTPQKGMWWPSLNDYTLWSMGKIGATSIILQAYSMIYPEAEAIDHIRQWLILQKQAKDWGTSVTTTQAISAILSTSKRWIAPAGKTKIKLGGKEIHPSSAERTSGYFRMPVEWKPGHSSSLQITRTSDSPAWGTLYMHSTQQMTEIESASCPELSIEKTLTTGIVNADGSSNIEFADTLSVGQKVKVTLTIKVERDMDYVTIVDQRAACCEPVEQMPKPIFAEGLYFYRENRDSETRIFIDHLPKGVYLLSYEIWANNAGTYASGIATIQSQYAPAFTAHSSGRQIVVNP